MKINVTASDGLTTTTPALVVYLFNGVKTPSGATGAIDKTMDGVISQLIKDGEIKGGEGEITLVHFYASNPTSKDMITQSIPSVTPGEAARYLHKTQCFCFDQQTLAAGERKDMPMIFYLDPEIPRHINQFTLSYTIFDVTERVAGKNNSVAVN